MTTQSGRLESLALAVLLAIGAGIVWFLIVGFSLEIVHEAFFSYHLVGERFIVLRDGTPVVEAYHGEAPHSYCTLDGKSLDSVDANNRISGELIRGPRWQGWVGDYWGRRITYLSRWSSDNLRDPLNWYFIHDGALHGHGYLVGYDPVTKLKAGCFGRNGFRPDEPPVEEQFSVTGRTLPFESAQTICHLLYPVKDPAGRHFVESRELFYLVTREGFVQIDLKARKVKVVRNDTNIVSVVQSAGEGGTIFARTPNRILVLDRDGKEVGAYSLPPELRRPDLEWYQLGKDRALVQAGWNGNDLFWLDAAGRTLRRERIDLRAVDREPSILRHTGTLLSAPSPGAIIAFLAATPLEGAPSQDDAAGYVVVVGRVLNRAWLRLLFAAVLSICLAVLCYRRQRKFALPWTWVWTIFVLLFGVPAYLGYLVHRSWPARLACPHCGRPAPRDRPACAGCHQDFPPPAPKGIEVFA